MFKLRPVSAFSRYVFFTLVSFVLVVLAFSVYVYAEKRVDTLNKLRFTSFQLADELRQSSEDLTRMVRSYVQTGNPVYKAHYKEILDIRDGHAPRPVEYQGIYWDLVLTDDIRPRPVSNEKKPLLDLMSEQGFTPEEFAKLAEAKANSDALTQVEYQAMAIVESAETLTDTVRSKAASLLHDQNYYHAKAGIMRPINEFNKMIDKRTQAAVDNAVKAAGILRWVFITFGMILLWMLWRTYHALRHTLGASVDEVHEHIVRLGRGDISTPIPVAKGMSDSVMDWLSETQINLAHIDAEEKAAKKHNERLTQLYAALSQCNQSIVRCQSQAELFPEICKVAVVFGGAKMAWIGLLDTHNQEIFPVASYGEGSAYLNGIYISTNPNESSGNGPTGVAVRENRPYWCQDYKNDPTTAPWLDRAAIYGWGSSASLPLHKNGEVVGAFTLYSAEVGAFDEDVRKLLEEMATDIDFALDRFEIEAERETYRENLQHSEESARLML